MQGEQMNRSKAFGASLVAVVLGGGILAVAGFALASATPHQTPLVCTSTGANSCSLTVSTYPDSLATNQHGNNGGPHPNWVSYSNDNLVVPANTTVYMTINQYDSGGALNDAFFSNVWGTTTGKATASFSSDAGKLLKTDSFSAWNPNDVGHTFTLRGIPGSGTNLFVSVPLPQNPSSATNVTIGNGGYAHPVVVKFSFKTGAPGVYQFNCEFPCGGSREGQFGEAMSSYSYMSGTLTVKG